MTFNLNPLAGLISAAKAKFLSIDANHNGKPDIIEVLEAGEAGADKAAALLSRFTPAEVASIVSAGYSELPEGIKNKITSSEMQELGTAIGDLGPALTHVSPLLKEIETELLKK